MSANASLPEPGTDVAGARLPIEIRIDVRGRVYFHDLPASALGLALALDPTSADVQRRIALAINHGSERTAAQEGSMTT